MELGLPIARGNTAEIYLRDNKIIKLFNDFLPEMEAMYEANKQKLAYSLGLSVPEIVDVTMIEGKQAIIMEYIEGKTFGEIVFENMDQAEFYMSKSIDIQMKVHSLTADSLEPMKDKLKRQIERVDILDKDYKEALLENLNTLVYEKRLCHGDFHLFNLIESNNKVTIIDWVDSSSGDIRADTCRTFLLYSEVSRDLAEMYLRLYCLKSGLIEEEILQWIPIIAGARLSEYLSPEKAQYLLDVVYEYCSI